ncbi:MAG: alpha/beta fold hydrolase [Candidatus Binatia bacterium]
MASTVPDPTQAGRAVPYNNNRHSTDAGGRAVSQVVQTAKGPVEYAISGHGPAVLVIHGCPGGYDQGLVGTKLATCQDFQFISPSRPGYLRTPLTIGETPEAQADAYAALLDALGISKAAIFGISGGGPSALQFALRYPERCWGLVTVCSIARKLTPAEIKKCLSPLRRLVFTANLVFQIIGNIALLAAEQCYSALARLIDRDSASSGRILNQKEKLHFLWGLLRTSGRVSLRKAGLANDLKQLATLPPYDLEKILAPTLVLHGKADELVAFSHARCIADRVPNATLIGIEGGGHIFFATHKEQVVPPVIEFLKRSASRSSIQTRLSEKETCGAVRFSAKGEAQGLGTAGS